jgi:glutamate 5-kinase
MNCRDVLKESRKLVVKIGTSSLSFPNGKLNYQRIERLAAVLCSLQSGGRKIVLVSSGAIAVGAGRIGLDKKPADLAGKQALAAIGQAGLIKMYQRFFDQHKQLVAQVLLTKDAVMIPKKRKSAQNTLSALMELGVIPIINENDTVSTEQIEFGDNDTLSAYVAELIDADLLVLLSDIDGLYSSDPRLNPDATIIPVIDEITPALEEIATGAGSSFGTGGMVTKIAAAKICWSAAIDVVITNGENPQVLEDILDGKETGTLFTFSEKMLVLNKKDYHE